KDGKHVDSDADRLISHYKHFSPEEQRQLRQDLADIDRLPTEKREAVYKSLDKIAHNDDLQKQDPKPKIELTGQQSRELVASLAPQVAHPESIQQGAHESCAAASMEGLMAREHPDRYADMVSNLATEGEYKLPPPSNKVLTAETHDGKLDPKSDA